MKTIITDVTEDEFCMLLSLRAMGDDITRRFGNMVDASFIALQKAHILEGQRIMAEWYASPDAKRTRTITPSDQAALNKQARLLGRPHIPRATAFKDIEGVSEAQPVKGK